jgi:hypothetical protein
MQYFLGFLSVYSLDVAEEEVFSEGQINTQDTLPLPPSAQTQTPLISVSLSLKDQEASPS